MTTPTDFSDVAVDAATSQGAVATGIILAIGAVAFGIKGLFVGWRAGNKAMSKTGS
jgi:hypothetical protein